MSRDGATGEERSQPPQPRPGVAAAFGMLLQPLVAPRAGFKRFLLRDEIDSFPLFSALMAYFVASLVYTFPLRRAAVAIPDMPAAAIPALSAAIPFIVSLVVLLAMLGVGAVLWIAARLARVRRPFGHWVGLAAFASLPGVLRVLIESVLLWSGGKPGVLTAANPLLWLLEPAQLATPVLVLLYALDPFLLWSLLVMAVGFAVYSERPLWYGGLIASLIWSVQYLIGLQLAA